MEHFVTIHLPTSQLFVRVFTFSDCDTLKHTADLIRISNVKPELPLCALTDFTVQLDCDEACSFSFLPVPCSPAESLFPPPEGSLCSAHERRVQYFYLKHAEQQRWSHCA